MTIKESIGQARRFKKREKDSHLISPSNIKKTLAYFKIKPLSLLSISLGLALSGAALSEEERISAIEAGTADIEVRHLNATRNNEQEEQADDDNEESEGEENKKQVERIAVTGSRLKNFEFNSDLPIEVFTAETGRQLGIGSTQELVRRSTLLTGSPQANNQSAVLGIGGAARNGGNGTNTLSLRGLGATRTLVLLNGRRLSPTGIRGAVSSPNISIIPSTALSRVEILKDGASSIYGSDAVAGVVNNQLIGRTNESVVTAQATPTEEGDGNFYQIAGRFSKEFDKGYLNIAAQADVQERVRIGARDFTDCRDPRLSDPVTGEPVLNLDANGEEVCRAFGGNNNRFFIFIPGGAGNFFDPTSILGRFGPFFIPDPDGTIIGPGQEELRAILPEFAAVGFSNLGITDPTVNFGPGSGDFAASSLSNSLLPQTSPLIQNANATNPEKRYSFFASGGYDVSDNHELYAQVLLSRVDTEVNSFRFLFDALEVGNPNNTVADRISDATDGFIPGRIGFNLIRPSNSRDITDYGNIVVGSKGTFGSGFSLVEDWDWDIYAQYGRSDADYTSNFTRNDRLDATVQSGTGCDPSRIITDLLPEGQTAESICDGISIPFLSTRILRDGQFTPEEAAFLEGTETGNTVYEQFVLEGIVTGDLFSTPAGQAALALGFHIRHDEIDDTPGANSLAQNNHAFSNQSITRGSATLQEVFTEIGIPLLEDVPFADRLAVTGSGRFTENNRIDDNGEFTYKLGISWAPHETAKFRYNVGTSYRTPALFELFQGGQQLFGFTDPCVDLENSNRNDNDLANLRNNCALFGIGENFQSTEALSSFNRGNSTGTLRAETSDALNIGFVWQPKFADLAVAIDYFDIEINDQIGRIGANAILNRCLANQSFGSIEEFEANPFCALLDDRDANNNLTGVTNGSINIASQTSRGIDYSVRYDRDFGAYHFRATGQVTRVIEDFLDLDRDIDDPVNDDFDRTLFALRPQYTGNFNLSVSKGPWSAFWAIQYVGNSDALDFELTDPDSNFDAEGTIQRFDRPFRFLGRLNQDTRVESYFEHTASFTYRFEDGYTATLGINNVFDREPPQVGGFVGRIGTSANGPYDFRGRRAFLRMTKTF